MKLGSYIHGFSHICILNVKNTRVLVNPCYLIKLIQRRLGCPGRLNIDSTCIIQLVACCAVNISIHFGHP